MSTMTVPLPTGGVAMIRFPSSAQSGDISMLGQMLVNLGSWWEFRERQDLDWNMHTACLASIQEMLP